MGSLRFPPPRDSSGAGAKESRTERKLTEDGVRRCRLTQRPSRGAASRARAGGHEQAETQAETEGSRFSFCTPCGPPGVPASSVLRQGEDREKTERRGGRADVCVRPLLSFCAFFSPCLPVGLPGGFLFYREKRWGTRTTPPLSLAEASLCEGRSPLRWASWSLWRRELV